MANINAPRPGKRRLLISATQSILLYGSEIWANVLKKKTYRERLTGVQYRSTLRIACSYRTVSVPADLVIAGVIPIELLALEEKHLCENARSRQTVCENGGQRKYHDGMATTLG